MRRVISIVIPTYNRPDSLARCLDAIGAQAGGSEAEVIVVDDGSSISYPDPEPPTGMSDRFQFIRADHGGRSIARNRGAKEARGDRLLFLGDDVTLEPDSLTRHIEAGRGEGDAADQAACNIALIGPNPLRPPARSADGDLADVFSAAFWRRFDPLANSSFTDGQDVGFRNFTTGNLSIDRGVFLKLGGFDEDFRIYGWEDIDLGYRFEKTGGRIVYDSRASAVHAHPTASRAELFRRETEQGASAYRFWSKWNAEDPEAVSFANFWGERPEPGPAWRRGLGRAAVGFLEAFSPASPRLDVIYERLVYSYRTLGAARCRRELEENSGESF